MHRSLSVSLQFILSENYSTRRCTFDVFVGGDKFHILLIHNLTSFKHFKIRLDTEFT